MARIIFLLSTSRRNATKSDPCRLLGIILDGLNLGAKERDLEPIGCKNTKIERQKYVSHKSEAWHGPC
ncbi:hypothetical protein MTR_8g066265 [Medicago truncatula]|uniref:Uncharacterized protein n=1 Tax=Medicago truncatula TaxID=3880 RepID=A0A072U2N5_MEDTR|nr:hypothetical protein MTR_8g066265 [Medicago truncatula]